MHHHNFWHFFKYKELNELYISMAVRSFSLSMIGIFMPIYLLNLGFSFSSVALFFAVLAFSHAVGTIPAGLISARFGYKHNILFSVPLLILAFLALYTLETFNWPLLAISVLFGVNNSLFWTGYHSDFSRFSHKKKRGSELSYSKIITSLFHVLGPITGGIVISLVGFKVLFVIVSILFFVAVFPLFKTKDVHDKFHFSLKDVFLKRKVKESFAFVGFGFERVAAGLVWPVFVFFFLLGESYNSLGILSSISLLFSFVFVFAIGRFADDYRKIILKIGAIANAFVWIVKSFVRTGMQVFMIDSVYGITSASYSLSFDAISYDKANKGNIMKYIVYREFMINMGRAVLFAALIFVSDLLFGILSGGVLGSLLMLLF